jgi:hypothetical protein
VGRNLKKKLIKKYANSTSDLSLNKLSIKNYLLNTNSNSIDAITNTILAIFNYRAIRFSLLKYYYSARLQGSSEVFPAVFDFPVSQSILSESFVGEWSHVDSLPLLGLSNLGQIFKTVFLSLESHGSGFVRPLSWCS